MQLYKLKFVTVLPLHTGPCFSKSVEMFDCVARVRSKVGHRDQKRIGVSALIFSTLFEAGYLTESGAVLAANKSQWSSCLCYPQCWDYRHAWGHISFDVGVKGLNFGLYGCPVSSLTLGKLPLNNCTFYLYSKQKMLYFVVCG